jgi:hypothetical protein
MSVQPGLECARIYPATHTGTQVFFMPCAGTIESYSTVEARRLGGVKPVPCVLLPRYRDGGLRSFKSLGMEEPINRTTRTHAAYRQSRNYRKDTPSGNESLYE